MTESDNVRRPTLVSLARELGVSRQTVSNAINAPHLVKKETLQRVRQRIEESGYRPSAVARALRNRRASAVAVRLAPLTDGISGTVMDRLLHATTEALREHRYHPVLFTADSFEDEVKAIRELYDSSAVDAALLAYSEVGDPRPQALQQARIPFAVFGRPWAPEPADHPWVDVDNVVGVADATRHLRSLGHTQIGFIGWGEVPTVGAERRTGWREGMAGLDVDLDRLDLAVDEGVREGREAMQVLRRRGATAAVCASDSLALGAASVLREEPVPGFDPTGSVVGFDDGPVALSLGLPSVAQPIEKVAAVLVEMVIAEVERRPGPRSLLLPSVFSPGT